MKLYYSDTFELPLPGNHRFPMAKYTLLRERIANGPLARTCHLEIPPSANDEQLVLAHNPEYIRRVKSGELTDLEIRRIGFPWSKKMVERSRRSTGATIAAAESALVDGISANLAGGTHHAFADNGQGYCVFNDVCVAAKLLQKNAPNIKNVLVIDLDVHQGNGTAGIAADDPTLFSFSMHCEKNYPFQKTDGDLDIALPPATEDEYYLSRLKHGLDEVFRKFKTDFAFYLAGADPFVGDRLGLLSLSKSGLRKRDEFVINFCRNQEIPIALSMAGGYAPEIEDIVDIHYNTIQVSADRFLKDQIPV